MKPDPVAPLREALRVSPDNVPLRLLVARTLLDAGRPREALAEAEEALLRAPHDGGAREVAGAAAWAMGDALGAWERWWPVRARLDGPGLRELARAALRAGRRDEAREAYDAALAHDPSLRDLELDRGVRLAVVSAGSSPSKNA